MSNYSADTNKRQSTSTDGRPVKLVLKPHETEFMRIITELEKSWEIPEVIGNVGEWGAHLEALLDAFITGGQGAYQAGKKALLKDEKRLMYMFSVYTPGAAPEKETLEDKRYAAGKNGKRVLKLASIEDIYAYDETEYLITKIIETASVSLLYGLSGTGKTFTTLNLALSVAHGLNWFGRKTKPGLVLYVNTEGGRGLKKRLMAWYKEHPELKPSSNFKVIPWAMDLRENYQALIDTIEDMDAPPVLIVLDNFSMIAPGVDQNKQEMVTQLFTPLHSIAAEYGCHIMVIHHTNKDGDVNGSMSFRNHVDTMIELRKEDKADKTSPIIFSCQKARDDEPFSDIRTDLKQVMLYINPVTLEPVTSCVVVECEKPAREEGLPDTAQNILDLLDDSGMSFSEWKKVVCSELKVSSATFERYIKLLQAKKYVGKTRLDGDRFDKYVKTPLGDVPGEE